MEGRNGERIGGKKRKEEESERLIIHDLLQNDIDLGLDGSDLTLTNLSYVGVRGQPYIDTGILLGHLSI